MRHPLSCPAPTRRQALCLAAGLAMAAWLPARGALANTTSATDNPGRSQALQAAADAVVGVEVLAVDGGSSSRTLGRARQGSGVVIGQDGLVLTIGYLVLEADQAQVVTDDGRRLPARVVAYDVATGFGLLRTLVPLNLAPVALGQARGVKPDDPLMIVSGGQGGAISVAQLVSRRRFAGYWEYLVDDALFTTPARPDHSGAGLFNDRGELVGIGSLIVNDAAGGNRRVAGNMFVPVDLLAPILPELLARGQSRQSQRAWLGLNCVELAGRLRVVRVTDDGPAARAGLAVGDQILALDGLPVATLEQLWQALWQGSSAERTVHLRIEREGQPRELAVHSIDRSRSLRRAEGA